MSHERGINLSQTCNSLEYDSLRRSNEGSNWQIHLDKLTRQVPMRSRVLVIISICGLFMGSVQNSFAEKVLVPSNVACRSNFLNALHRFREDKAGHVAFMGGSITEMNGYRPLVMDFLQAKFPQTRFQFTDAGISSTCSTAGAFRLQQDVLSRGEVDLFFVEFAVNDDQDAAHSLVHATRGMEGILRHLRRHSPYAEIVVTYFVNPGMLEKLSNGEVPTSVAAHEKVAEYYGATTIHLAQEVAERIQKGTLTWKQFGGVHPAPYGNAIPAHMIQQTLEAAWNDPLSASISKKKFTVPGEKLDPFSYDNGRYVPLNQIKLGSGWEVSKPDWESIQGSVRPRHKDLPFIVCNVTGEELSFSFNGTAVGVECVAGPDAGHLEFSIDEGPWQSFNLSHRYSKGLHYPRTVVLADELAPQNHSIRIRLLAKKSDYGLAPVARILNFVVNESEIEN